MFHHRLLASTTKTSAQIDHLPPELLGKIFTEHDLEPHALAQIARVCKAFAGEATRASYLYNIENQRSSVVVLAAQQGRIDWLQKALSMGANINTVGPGCGDIIGSLEHNRVPYWGSVPEVGQYATPLHYAALRGDDGMVRLLLKSGANMNVPSFRACDCHLPHYYNYNSAAVRWVPLHHAMCQGHLSTANLLLDYGAPLNMSYRNNSDESGVYSLIHEAAFRGQDVLVQRAIDMGTDPSVKSFRPITAIHYAVESWSSEATIRCLVAAGAELDGEDSVFGTPLSLACVLGNFPAAMQLLMAGASPELPPSQTWANGGLIHEAAISGWQGYKLDKRPDLRDDTEQIEFLRSLIEDHGIDVDQNDIMGRAGSTGPRLFTPLHSALESATSPDVARVAPGVIRLLLDKGADPNIPHPRGWLPLEQVLRQISPSGRWKQSKHANELREIVADLVAHGAYTIYVGEGLHEDMRRWVGDEAVDAEDRSLFMMLLRNLDQEELLFQQMLAVEAIECSMSEPDMESEITTTSMPELI